MCLVFKYDLPYICIMSERTFFMTLYSLAYSIFPFIKSTFETVLKLYPDGLYVSCQS